MYQTPLDFNLLDDVCIIFFDKINLSEYLMKHKLAYHYTGDTKLTEEEQLEMLS